MHKSITRFPELDALLGTVVWAMRNALGDNLVGVYLHGSFALGGADENSDVDLIVVTDEEIRFDEIAALGRMHPVLYRLDSRWAKHLEGSYFSRDVLTDAESTEQVWYFDNGSVVLERSTHDNTAVVRWVEREHAIALAGPPAKEVFGFVTTGALCAEVRTTMTQWAMDIQAAPAKYDCQFYQPFVALSYARMLHTLNTGRVHSKPAALHWARGHLDAYWVELLEASWAQRPGQWAGVGLPADPKLLSATLAFVDYAGQIATHLEESSSPSMRPRERRHSNARFSQAG